LAVVKSGKMLVAGGSMHVVYSTNYGNKWFMQIDHMERHQHMTQHVLIMLISTLNTYACLGKRTLFHNVL
jgi:hypothetical protein